MLFYNGRILTMDRNQPQADYVEIQGNLITRVGRGELPQNAEEKIDLEGRTLLPGLFDTHLHMGNYGSVLKSVPLRGCNSVAELAERIKKRVDQVSPDQWIFGQGWDENRYGGQLPTRDDLDQVAPANPVFIIRVCGHLIVVNSRALQVLGLDDSIVAPEGGAIDRTPEGRMTGVFRETAMDLVFGQMPHRGMDELEENLRVAGESVLSLGITTVHTDDLGGVEDLSVFIEMYRKLWRAGQLPRTHLHIHFEELEQAKALGLKTGISRDGITIGAVKIFADGSLGARTAAMLEDYSDAPGERGILIYSDAELYRMVKAAHSADFSLAIHGIGDAATSQAVRIMARVQEEEPKPYLRHRMVHAQILTEEVIALMAQYNIIAEIQPVFINTDLHWAARRVGERMKTSYNWQTLLQKGIHLTGSSDCPVEPVNPFYGIYAATTRRDLEGQPNEGWYPEEALTREQAFDLFTGGGAYTGHEEAVAGSLTEGKRADLILIDRSIDQIPLEEIKDVNVLMTIMDGRIVYQKTK